MRIDEITNTQKTQLINYVKGEYLKKFPKHAEPQPQQVVRLVKTLCTDKNSDLHVAIVRDVVSRWKNKNKKMFASKTVPDKTQMQSFLTGLASDPKASFYEVDIFNNTIKPYQYVNVDECINIIQEMYGVPNDGENTDKQGEPPEQMERKRKKEVEVVKNIIQNKMTLDQVKKLIMYLGDGRRVDTTVRR